MPRSRSGAESRSARGAAILAAALVAASAAALSATAPPSASAGLAGLSPGMARGVDVVLVTLDTTRPDRLGCYGGPVATPAVDALAARGFRFDAAIAVAPITLPAHTSILTGLYPPSSGVRSNGEYRLGPGPATLAELLRASGRKTGAFVSAFVLDARYGLDRGFDTYDDRVSAAKGPSFPSGTQERRADATTDAALSWIARQRKEDRLFLWVHYFDPHAPYEAPEPWPSRFPGRPYLAEIAFVDAQIGRLAKGLAAAGRLDRALVVVVGDHGESLGEHGEATHGIFVYDSTVRVPLLIRPPGGLAKPAIVADRVVSQVDLLPTVLDLLGLPDRAKRDGVSLLSPAASGRAVYAESLLPNLDFGWAPLHALRRRNAKVVFAPRPEYYDLVSDPTEEKNLAGAAGGLPRDGRELAADLRGRLDAWSRTPASSAQMSLTEEERARLASLGYLTGSGGDSGGDLADPKDRIGVAALLVEANSLTEAGRLAEAVPLLTRALRESPRDRSVLRVAGKLFLRQGRLKDAEMAFRAFTKVRPAPDVSLLLAQILLLDGRVDEAERILREAEALDPKHGGVQIAWGDLEVRRGRVEDARRRYRKAAEIDPYRAAGAAGARLGKLGSSAK